MEDVLDVYQRPADPKRPLVNLDEKSKELHADSRPPQPAAPGRVKRVDSEYEREGTANLFMVYAPLEGWRHVEVTDRRTRVDFARVVKDLVDERYPEADAIVLVMDNLNTHSPASLYAAFAPEEAKRLADKLESHYVPKHGSWLNVAEIELSALERQCLDERMANRARLESEVAAWEAQRNRDGVCVAWRFTTADARIKLKQLYPTVLPG
jgi:DDE superfamily endonuclease